MSRLKSASKSSIDVTVHLLRLEHASVLIFQYGYHKSRPNNRQLSRFGRSDCSLICARLSGGMFPHLFAELEKIPHFLGAVNNRDRSSTTRPIQNAPTRSSRNSLPFKAAPHSPIHASTLSKQTCLQRHRSRTSSRRLSTQWVD